MKDSSIEKFTWFSHANYMENDPVSYNITAQIYTLTSDQVLHFHDDIELLYILDGSAVLSVNREINHISSGSLVMLLPYHIHSISHIDPKIVFYQCHISMGLLLFSSISRVMEKHLAYSLIYGNVMIKLPETEMDRMKSSFEELMLELDGNSELSTMVGLSIVNKIIILFARYVSSQIKESGISAHTLMWNLLQYLEENFSADLNTQNIAAYFSLSPLKINNYFYAFTGENFATNLHRTRIRHACSMLQFDNLSVSYIGNYVGYKNTASFFRKFREIKNMTPDEYRRSHNPTDSIYRSLNSSWKILLYLFEHYAEPLNETSVSQALFLTPEHIHAELLSDFDSTLPDILTMIRLRYACSFLQATNEPILKISILSGFSSVRTFNRCFQNRLGCTPLEYRTRGIPKYSKI